MYRAEAARSGYTSDSLPDNLSLVWTRKMQHPPMPAWPGRSRLTFDCAYQPVIGGRTVYLGSSADGRIYALDAATGEDRWTFFTDGPVRFAPVVWHDRVLAAGDDGCLYCLAAADGELLWKLRAGPRADMLLGNDRMISRWPARGGPVVADGVLYFAAGIWPSEGVFLYALDPISGKVLWCNDSSGSIEMDQPHPTARAESGVAAQGYLAAAGDLLLLPTGRAVPAVFERIDGTLRYFHLQREGKAGGWDVAAVDGHFFNGGLIFATADGANHNRFGRQVAADAKLVFCSSGNKLSGIDRAHLLVDKEVVDRKGQKVMTKVLSRPLWTVTLPHDANASLIVAGDKAIAGGTDKISVIDVAAHKTTWTADVEGIAYGLAVADGRLYVSTDRGLIHCFGVAGDSRPRRIGAKPRPASDDGGSPYAAAAEEIVRRTGLTQGYCLDLACGDGHLAMELAKRTKLQIYAVDADADKVQAARQMLDTAGLYGVRVTVHQADVAEVRYPNYFADLVVSGRSVRESPDSVPAEALQRMQRPYGGIACLGRPGAMTLSVRGPLKEAGNWTHQYTNPANTLCSDDSVVRGPLEMLWFRDTDFLMPDRHGKAPAPLVCDGRMFVEGIDAVRAQNVYNGRVLWEFSIPGVLASYHLSAPGGSATGSNICTDGDCVYVRVGDRCICLGAQDGVKVAEFKAPLSPDGKPGTWGFIACEDGMVFGSLSNEEHRILGYSDRFELSRHYSESRLFFALDAKTGKLKWTYQPRHSVRHNAVAIGGGRVYLVDRPLASIDTIGYDEAKTQGEAKRRAQANGTSEAHEFRKLTEHPLGVLLALDARSGDVLWKSSQHVFGTMLAVSLEHDVLLTCCPARSGLPSDRGGRMAAVRASDGTELWDVQARYTTRPLLNDRVIYAQPGAWNLVTGERLPFEFTRSYGCGTLAGSRRLLVFRSATLGYFDLAGARRTENYGGIRPGCWVNAIPAGGLVLMADAASWCRCSYLNQATIALQPCLGSATSPSSQRTSHSQRGR
jgi:outer membrane protein assembly factor BamB